MADNLGREAIPGVAGASGCPHPTQLPIPIRWRNRGKARQVDGAEHVATFLGHKITAQLAQEIGSQFTTRIEGTCVKHRFSKSSIKIYDKFGHVLRIETTTNDVSAFKHYRKVEHRQGPATRALAPVR